MSLAPVVLTDARGGFLEMLGYLKVYNAQPPFNLALISMMFKQVYSFFGDIFSLSLSLSVAMSVNIVFLGRGSERQQQTIFLCVLLSALMLLSVLAERKFITAHYVRTFVPLVLAASFGLYHYIVTLRKNAGMIGSAGKLLGFILIVGLIVFSPVLRALKEFVAVRHALTSEQRYDEYYTDSFAYKPQPAELKMICEYLTLHRNIPEKSFVMGIGAAHINTKINEQPWSVFAHSQYYFANGVSQSWKNRLYEEMKLADWIVLLTKDVYPFQNGHDRSSEQSLEQDTNARKYLHDNFALVAEFRSSKIYHRKIRQ
jgi:hypothetical protein